MEVRNNVIYCHMSLLLKLHNSGQLFLPSLIMWNYIALSNVLSKGAGAHRIGLVPVINIGDEFQYKTKLRLVGLHFKTMSGIDYMNIGDVKLATSIVASEEYGYSDHFGDGVVVYTCEGGNVVSKEKKTED